MAFISAVVSLLYYAFYYCCLQKVEGAGNKHGTSLAITCNSLSLPKSGSSSSYKKSDIPNETVRDCVLEAYRIPREE